MINKQLIERFWYLQTWKMDFELFTKIFNRHGEDSNNPHSLANHMWKKYTGGNNNLLSFWKQCDKGNQQAIVDYINSEEFNKEFRKNMEGW